MSKGGKQRPGYGYTDGWFQAQKSEKMNTAPKTCKNCKNWSAFGLCWVTKTPTTAFYDCNLWESK